MNSHHRRIFILRLIGSGTLLAGAQARAAEESDKVAETDPYPKSMGFRLDTANVDQAKFPRHTVEQHCSECQLFSGKPGEPIGPCSFYGGRLVPVKGWCRNFKVKKAKA